MGVGLQQATTHRAGSAAAKQSARADHLETSPRRPYASRSCHARTSSRASIGYRPIDVVGLSAARYLEGMAFLNIALNAGNGWSWRSGWKLVGPLA